MACREPTPPKPPPKGYTARLPRTVRTWCRSSAHAVTASHHTERTTTDQEISEGPNPATPDQIRDQAPTWSTNRWTTLAGSFLASERLLKWNTEKNFAHRTPERVPEIPRCDSAPRRARPAGAARVPANRQKPNRRPAGGAQNKSAAVDQNSEIPTTSTATAPPGPRHPSRHLLGRLGGRQSTKAKPDK